MFLKSSKSVQIAATTLRVVSAKKPETFRRVLTPTLVAFKEL